MIRTVLVRAILGVGFLGLVLSITPRASADVDLIINGGFEDAGGSLNGWTVLDQGGSSGSFFLQTGGSSPLNGFPVPPPPGGSFAAMTDAIGPGSHLLYQDIAVPVGGVMSATLSFDIFINNQNGDFFTPDSLDFNVFPNQQARADVITTAADPFSVAGGDVLANVYQTMVGDPATSGYATVTTDLTALLNAHAGETVRVRFAEVDNQNAFNLGVDNVSLRVTAVPEPAALLLLGSGAVGLLAYRRHRARRAA
jgi:hypothetical protein